MSTYINIDIRRTFFQYTCKSTYINVDIMGTFFQYTCMSTQSVQFMKDHPQLQHSLSISQLSKCGL